MPVQNASESASNTPNIAVVDDDESMREALRNLLMSVGFAVSTFASAETFLLSSVIPAVSCLISDIHMPAMGGLELQRHLLAAGHSVPIIFITAFPRAHVARQAQELGAVSLLAKPFDGNHLIACVEEALGAPKGA